MNVQNIIDIADQVGQFHQLGLMRKGWRVFYLKLLANILWQGHVIRDFLHNRRHFRTKILTQFFNCCFRVFDGVMQDGSNKRYDTLLCCQCSSRYKPTEWDD